MKISGKENKRAKQFISKNAEILIEYYLQGKQIDTDDFLDSLQKV